MNIAEKLLWAGLGALIAWLWIGRCKHRGGQRRPINWGQQQMLGQQQDAAAAPVEGCCV